MYKLVEFLSPPLNIGRTNLNDNELSSPTCHSWMIHDSLKWGFTAS